MRLLCLHGAGSNAKAFQTILAPIAYELTKRFDIQFSYLDGPIECEPAIGMVEHYAGPYYRFLSNDTSTDMQIAKLARAVSRTTSSPEAYAREMRKRGKTDVHSSLACDYLEAHLDSQVDGPFDGVISFSEGAAVVASLILRRQAQGMAAMFKFAVFICGSLVVHHSDKGVLLADEVSERILIPTAHIVGSKDPGRQASLTLYNLCDCSSASLFDHGEGHAVPWGRSSRDIAEEICGVIQRAQVDKKSD